MWRAVFVVLATLAVLWALRQAMDLVVIVVVATFLALAIPARCGRPGAALALEPGAATVAVMVAVFLAIAVLIGFLIPAMVDVAGKLTQEVPQWLEDARKSGLDLPLLKESDAELLANAEDWLKKNGGTHVLSLAGSGAG